MTPFIMDSSTMFWSFLCNTTKRKTRLFFTNKFILHLFWRLGSLEVVFFFLSRKHFFPLHNVGSIAVWIDALMTFIHLGIWMSCPRVRAMFFSPLEQIDLAVYMKPLVCIFRKCEIASWTGVLLFAMPSTVFWYYF